MRGLNLSQVIGNLGAKPELKYTASGVAVANITLAVNYAVKRGDKWVDAVEWIRCILWDKKALAADEYLDKGSSVYVSGRLCTRSWEDKDGVKRYSTEIIVKELIFLGGKSQGQSQNRPPVPPDEYEPALGSGPGTDAASEQGPNFSEYVPF